MNKPYLLRSSLLSAACATLLSGLTALTAADQPYSTSGSGTSTTDQSTLNPSPRPGAPTAAYPSMPPRVASDYDATHPLGKATRQTENLVSKLSQLSSEQLRLSQIAAQRATHSQVRSLAQGVQESSQSLQQELDQIARNNNVLVPTGKSPNDWADEEEKWQKKDGKDFDEDYVKRVVKSHKDAIDQLEDYSKDKDNDAAIVSFANKHLPTLREHLRQAEAVKDQVD